MKTIIICTTQRSGSTMVCEDMTRIGLGKPNEYFLSWIGEQGADWQKELIEMVETKTENSVFSVKIMANQIRQVDIKLAEIVSPLDSGPFPHFRAAFPDAEWMFIKRADSVDQAISHYLAKKSGVYHVVKGRSGFTPGAALHESVAEEKISEVPYHFAELLEEWHTLQAGNLLWQEFFREIHVEPFTIEYSTYDRETLVSFGQQLGVETRSPNADANLIKMPNRRNLKLKEQFKNDLFKRL